MITSVIFSKNRACQLDLLLRSIHENLPRFIETYVLYCATNNDFACGYEKLIKKFRNISFVKQDGFEQDTRTLLENIDNEYVCFFVDDNIIYRPCSAIDTNMLDILFDELNLTCFSLRLGSNTIIQDIYNNTPTMFPQELYCTMMEEMVLFWDWTAIMAFGNFGYPFSVDGHIYKIKDLLPLLNYEFDNPNGFEGRFNKCTFSTTKMACFEKSVLVNNPLNLVGSSNNNAGKFWGHTLEELNQKFLDGYQINLNSICRNKIISSHQEMEIEFEQI